MAPKVSILIPSYNRPCYFKQALQSALDQTYRDFEIIVSDDSDTDEIRKIVEEIRNTTEFHINYFHNEKRLGFAENFRRSLELAKGEYVNYLLDDDLFYPQKIERMVEHFLGDPEVTLVTSNRVYINDDGENIRNSFTEMFKLDRKMDGLELGNLMLKSCCNYIGEPTVALFKKAALTEPYGIYKGKKNRNNSDVASWLNLLKKGKVVYIADILSYIRIHQDRVSGTPDAALKRISDWIDNIIDAVQDGYLSKQTDFLTSLQNLNKTILTNLFKVCESDIVPQKGNLIHCYSRLMIYLDYIKKNQSQEGFCNYLIKSLADFYNYSIWKLKLKDLISYLKSNIDLNNREIFIWGAGSGGLKVLQILRSGEIKIQGFLDSNYLNFPGLVQGLQVFSPTVLSEKKNKPYVIIGSMFLEDIQKQLLTFDYEYEKDYI